MKPTLRRSIPEVESSFVVGKDVGSTMKNNWHYHTKCEFVVHQKKPWYLAYWRL